MFNKFNNTVLSTNVIFYSSYETKIILKLQFWYERVKILSSIWEVFTPCHFIMLLKHVTLVVNLFQYVEDLT